LLVLVAAVLSAAAPALGKVFLSKSEGLALAFSDASRIESRTHVLTGAQLERVEALARAPLDSKLVTVHRGLRGEEVLGFAFLDVHTVRTLPEALLVVLTPAGTVRSLRVLAFHEPPEYLPSERWLGQFQGLAPGARLRLQREVDGIAGATLSARAATRGVRRALALFEVLVREEE
jgi:hypothetical protein